MECMERAPAATAPTVWALRVILIFMLTPPVFKVMSQEQTDRLQCTGLSRNEQICPSKKSFSWHLVCSLLYFCFWEGVQDNSVHHNSEGIWVYLVPTPLSTNKYTVWCTGKILEDKTNRTWFYSALIYFNENGIFLYHIFWLWFPLPLRLPVRPHLSPFPSGPTLFLSLIRK